MKEYTVHVPYAVWVTVKVELEDDHDINDIIEQACYNSRLTSYNGLVGPVEYGFTIEAGSEPLDGAIDFCFDIEGYEEDAADDVDTLSKEM